MSDPRPCQGDCFHPARHVARHLTCLDCAEAAYEVVWGVDSAAYTSVLPRPIRGEQQYGKCLGMLGKKWAAGL
jgi:hypothetical protein